jgi:protease IV
LQVKRIGKYKSAGDQILRKDMSEAQAEQLTALLDGLYNGFVDAVAKVRLLL